MRLTDYFAVLPESRSWNTVNLDLYGHRFYYEHMLRQPRFAPNLIEPAQGATATGYCDRRTSPANLHRHASTQLTRVFYTRYGMGLRLGKGLRLRFGDSDNYVDKHRYRLCYS